MKQKYIKPEQIIIMLQQSACLLDTSITDIDSPFDYEGPGGDEPGRCREYEWEE